MLRPGDVVQGLGIESDRIVASSYEGAVEDLRTPNAELYDIDRARGFILDAVRGTEEVLAEPAPGVLLLGWPAGTTDVPASRKAGDATRQLSGSKLSGAEGE